jgi:hypothetical protein
MDQSRFVAERPHGTHSRQLVLGDTLDSENVQVNYEHGVLTRAIPVAEAAPSALGPRHGGTTLQPRGTAAGAASDRAAARRRCAGG